MGKEYNSPNDIWRFITDSKGGSISTNVFGMRAVLCENKLDGKIRWVRPNGHTFQASWPIIDEDKSENTYDKPILINRVTDPEDNYIKQMFGEKELFLYEDRHTGKRLWVYEESEGTCTYEDFERIGNLKKDLINIGE
jgi:hypothetical protein